MHSLPHIFMLNHSLQQIEITITLDTFIFAGMSKKQAFSNKLLLNIISAKIYQEGLSKEMCMFCWRTVTNNKYILDWSSNISRRLSEFIIASSHCSSSTSLSPVSAGCVIQYLHSPLASPRQTKSHLMRHQQYLLMLGNNLQI